ncbi:MAG: hypothetical protein ACK4YF_00385 [Exilispira sp.]
MFSEFIFQNYIKSFIKDKSIVSLYEENESNVFIASIIELTSQPQLLIIDKKGNIVKQYQYKKDFSIKFDRFSQPLSINKKAITLTDSIDFKIDQNDIVLMPNIYFNEINEESLYKTKASVIITDKYLEEIEKENMIFFNFLSKLSKSDNKSLEIQRNKESKGFNIIYVIPEVYSEIANLTYRGFSIKINSQWKTNQIVFSENIVFLPGKSRKDLLIFQIPVYDNIENLALFLSLTEYINKNIMEKRNLYLPLPVIIFFSNSNINDFQSELNFINNFKKFPENTKVLIFNNKKGYNLEINTFITKNNKSLINSTIDLVSKQIKKDKIDFKINYFDTEDKHFAYIFSKIPAISLNKGSLSFDKDIIDKDIINDDKIAKNNNFTEDIFLKLNLKILSILIFQISKKYKATFLIFFFLFFIIILIFLKNDFKKENNF